jgi:hypothetical protein
VLLKVVDSTRETVGNPTDVFVEGRMHEAISRALKGTHRVGAYVVERCPHVPMLLDLVTQPPYQFLFMEIVEHAQSLNRCIDVLSPMQLKASIFQTLYALACLQKALPGFRHNDLHLSNILLSPRAPPSAYVLKRGSREQFFDLRSARAKGAMYMARTVAVPVEASGRWVMSSPSRSMMLRMCRDQSIYAPSATINRPVMASTLLLLLVGATTCTL